MGLFDRKYCDVCGDKIRLLGNKKLKDGNLCKNCASQLSPWFDERRDSRVEEIKEQLAYREKNKEVLQAFSATRSFGQQRTKLLLDEKAKKFLVTKTGKLHEENPDVLDYSQVTGCDLDINERKQEKTREVKSSDGKTKKVSYQPPRYTYSYDFYVRIYVNHPYFNEIKYRLNRSSIEYEPRDSSFQMNTGQVIGSVLTGLHDAVSIASSGRGAEASGRIDHALSSDPRMQIPDYAECYRMGMEIKTALSQIQEEVRDEYIVASQPKQAVTCPHCHATTYPTESSTCEYCGGALN